MPNYIDRDVVIEMITEDLPGLVYYGKEEAIDCIESVPVADVKEVRHARWERTDNYKVECTNCHHIRDIKTQCGWNFCPTCGAKIDLED